jgi:hypothetical protein
MFFDRRPHPFPVKTLKLGSEPNKPTYVSLVLDTIDTILKIERNLLRVAQVPTTG